MKKLLSKILIGSAVLGGGLVAPLIPQEMTWVMSYQDRPSMHLDSSYTTATSTYADPFMQFSDDDNNDLISIAVFMDSKGKLVYEQTSDAEYASLGRKDGYKNNPKKTELVSVLGARVAKGAIAFDAGSGASNAGSPATSITWAHTITGTNTFLTASCFSGVNDPSTFITGITANGSAMTRLVSVNSGSSRQSLFGIIAPTTGNIVASFDASRESFCSAASFTGVNQSITVDNSGSVVSSGTTVDLTLSITSVADNAWMVMSGGAQRIPSAGTNSTQRGASTPDANSKQFSFGPKTPAGSISMQITYSSIGDAGMSLAGITLAPFVAGATASSPQDLIIISDE